VPPGEWQVRAEHPESRRRALGEVWVGDGEAVLDLVFPPVEPADAWLAGRILGSGRPVAGAIVGLEPVDPSQGTRMVTTEADAEGGFRFDAVVSGRYRLRVRGFAANGPPPVVEVGDGEPLVVDLPSVPVAGRVVDPTGQPLSRVQVSLRPRERPNGWIGHGSTDAAGRFLLPHVSPGLYVLGVYPTTHRERQPVHQELLVEAPGVTGVEIVLE
jgi:hypothetical protein